MGAIPRPPLPFFLTPQSHANQGNKPPPPRHRGRGGAPPAFFCSLVRSSSARTPADAKPGSPVSSTPPGPLTRDEDIQGSPHNVVVQHALKRSAGGTHSLPRSPVRHFPHPTPATPWLPCLPSLPLMHCRRLTRTPPHFSGAHRHPQKARRSWPGRPSPAPPSPPRRRQRL